MTKLTHLPLAITQQFDCSYLPDKTEQLIFVQSEQPIDGNFYQHLMERGFRRSGNDVYRPHCPSCSACQSIRITALDFVASKSQKRLKNKNKNLTIKISTKIQPTYWPLYQRYITSRHSDGSMFPPNKEQLLSFAQCDWMNIQFIELYLQDQLISVAVVDRTPNALSAVYTFFDPDFTKLSLGSYSILLQIDLALKNNIEFVYLGYFIGSCPSMKYKQNYLPNARFIQDKWIIFKN